MKSFFDTHLNYLGPPPCFALSWVSLWRGGGGVRQGGGGGVGREEVRRTTGADGFMGMKAFVY